MKVIELGSASPSLDDVIVVATEEPVVLRRPDGAVFVLSQVDDFDVEVESLRKNPDFMALLRQFSREEATITLEDLRKQLAL